MIVLYILLIYLSLSTPDGKKLIERCTITKYLRNTFNIFKQQIHILQLAGKPCKKTGSVVNFQVNGHLRLLVDTPPDPPPPGREFFCVPFEWHDHKSFGRGRDLAVQDYIVHHLKMYVSFVKKYKLKIEICDIGRILKKSHWLLMKS